MRYKEPVDRTPNILCKYKTPEGKTVTVYKPLTAEGSRLLSYEELENHVEASD
jgi:hypothetical protein